MDLALLEGVAGVLKCRRLLRIDQDLGLEGGIVQRQLQQTAGAQANTLALPRKRGVTGRALGPLRHLYHRCQVLGSPPLELDPQPQFVAAGLLPSGGIAHLEVTAAGAALTDSGGVLGIEEIQHGANEL